MHAVGAPHAEWAQSCGGEQRGREGIFKPLDRVSNPSLLGDVVLLRVDVVLLRVDVVLLRVDVEREEEVVGPLDVGVLEVSLRCYRALILVRALREIRHYQKQTSLLLPLRCFERLCRRRQTM
jgi:hypothetical protein